MNVWGLSYGKLHWKKGLFRTKPSDTRTNNRLYTNKLRFMISCVISKSNTKKPSKSITLKAFIFLVTQSGIEPETYSLEGCCSIQLSYWAS